MGIEIKEDQEDIVVEIPTKNNDNTEADQKNIIEKTMIGIVTIPASYLEALTTA